MNSLGRYSGMTVNERLFEAGLIEAFDVAAKARNRSEMIRILTEVEVPGADVSTDTILANPERYGY